MLPLRLRRTRVASFAGIDWCVDASAILLAVFVLIILVGRYWTGFATLAAYVLLIVAHEAGHIAFAKIRGFVVKRVTFGGFFGLVETYDPAGRNRLADVGFIASGGVAAQLLLLVAATAVSFIPGVESYALLYEASVVLVVYNAFLIAMNLLPVRPLDGAVIWPALRARRVARTTQRRRKNGLRLVK